MNNLTPNQNISTRFRSFFLLSLLLFCLSPMLMAQQNSKSQSAPATLNIQSLSQDTNARAIHNIVELSQIIKKQRVPLADSVIDQQRASSQQTSLPFVEVTSLYDDFSSYYSDSWFQSHGSNYFDWDGYWEYVSYSATGVSSNSHMVTTPKKKSNFYKEVSLSPGTYKFSYALNAALKDLKVYYVLRTNNNTSSASDEMTLASGEVYDSGDLLSNEFTVTSTDTYYLGVYISNNNKNKTNLKYNLFSLDDFKIYKQETATVTPLTATFSPNDGDTDIPFDSNITISFSEPIAYGGIPINTANNLNWALDFTNYYSSMIVLYNYYTWQFEEFTATLGADSKTITLTPNQALAANTIYIVDLYGYYISDVTQSKYLSGTSYVYFITEDLNQLDSPENLALSSFSKDQVTLNWDAVDHNSGYLVTLYDDNNTELEQKTVTSTSVTMSLSTYSLDQKYTFSVVALGDNVNYTNSDASTYLFSTIQLSLEGLTIESLAEDRITILWDENSHATGYEVSIQGENDSQATIYNITDASITSYTFGSLLGATEYTIKVIAKGDLRYYLDSEEETRIYTTLDRYTMTWISGMGYLSDEDAVSSHLEGNQLQMPTPTSPASWSFTGWSRQNVGMTTSSPALISSTYVPTADQSFYAVYNSTEIEGTTVYSTDEISILVHTSVNGVSTDLTQNSPIASEDIANEIITVDGMTFQGWSSIATATDGDSTPPVYFTFPVINETTLYAVFLCANDSKYYTLIPNLVWNIDNDTTDVHKTETYNTLIVDENKSLSMTKSVNLESVTLKQGATLTIDPSMTLSTQYLDIVGNDESCAQIELPDNSTLKVTQGIRFNCKLTSNARFYFFSLPYDCLVDDVNILKDDIVDSTMQFGIYWYDSESYADATTHDNLHWIALNSGDTIKKDKGYIIYNRQSFEVIARFTPLDPLLNYTFDPASKIPAKQTSINSTDVAFWNWSLVGTPFLTSVGKDHKTKIKGISSNTTLMVSQPNYNDNCRTYYQKKVDETEILPFSSYFVQVGTTGDISFKHSDVSGVPAAAYLLNDELTLSLSTLDSSNDSSHTSDLNDELYIDVNDQFTTGYEIGSDLFKMLGKTTRPQFFSISTNNNLVYNALPSAAISAIPLGYYTGTTETYVIKAIGTQNYNATHLYLTDHINLETVDLMVADYQFEGTAKDYNLARFTLNIVRQSTPTQTGNVNETSIQIFTEDDHFVINQLKEGYHLELIDAAGRIIYASEISSSSLQLKASEGIYFIRYTNPLGQTTSYKAIMP